jgi:glutathione-regulated potassium-efflux system protein KefB
MEITPLVQIIIFLAAALLLVPLGKRFGIPTVLGYLVTGTILGPSVLNIAHDTEQIAHLAEYGVIMLMFLIGLELRPQRLWELRQSILLMGSLQMLISGIVLTLAIWLVFSWQFNTSVVIGFALALSSTAFVLQLLRDRDQLATSFGQQTFSILLFQDVAAMVLLALIPVLAGNIFIENQGSAHHGIAYFAAVIASFSGLFLFSRYILRPFFRFVAKSAATELLTAVALFIVLGVAVLMEAIGLSTTLGAFLTGVLLADSEFRHELEASIQPFKGLLLGLFFMTVGMGVSLHVIVEQPLLIVFGTLALMVIKIVCVAGIALYRKSSALNSLRLGVALSQGGEFAFVVFAVAASEGMINQAMTSPLTLIVTLSMILTPIFFWIIDHWIEPILSKNDIPQAYDELPKHDQHIIVAGFGRFGQILTRIAHLHQIPFTAIDNNIDHIDFMRRFGGHVYYGDATVPEILQSAGVETAKLFVIAVDDVEDSLYIARHLRLHYPSLTVLARARDRRHVYQLRELGIDQVWRESVHSALSMSEQMLNVLGYEPERSKNHVANFAHYDEKLIRQQQANYNVNPQKMRTAFDTMMQDLQNLFENDEFVHREQMQKIEKHQPIKDEMSGSLNDDEDANDSAVEHSEDSSKENSSHHDMR